MTKETILIIDDEPQIRKLLQINLETNGYKLFQADTADMGMRLAANHLPDLIILDIGLPDKTGLELLLELRSWYPNPIIMLSVMDQELAIVEALDNGASDYVTKPFRTNELLARIRSSLKQAQHVELNTVLAFDNIQIDLIARTVMNATELVKLTATEFKLLILFAKNEGRVLTHQFLLKEIWGIGYQTDTQYLRVFVGTLRKKIEKNPNKPVHIITESGVGYRFM